MQDTWYLSDEDLKMLLHPELTRMYSLNRDEIEKVQGLAKFSELVSAGNSELTEDEAQERIDKIEAILSYLQEQSREIRKRARERLMGFKSRKPLIEQALLRER